MPEIREYLQLQASKALIRAADYTANGDYAKAITLANLASTLLSQLLRHEKEGGTQLHRRHTHPLYCPWIYRVVQDCGQPIQETEDPMSHLLTPEQAQASAASVSALRTSNDEQAYMIALEALILNILHAIEACQPFECDGSCQELASIALQILEGPNYQPQQKPNLIVLPQNGA